MAKPPMQSRLMHVESASGIPVISVKGTPRLIGRMLGERLKPRLRVLIQDVSSMLCQLSGDNRLMDEVGAYDQDATLAFLAELLGHTPEMIQDVDPGQWMELESLAEACKVDILFLLAITAFNDLANQLLERHCFFTSNTAMVPANRYAEDAPLLANDWSVPPYLVPHLMLIRRVPSHGPASLALSLGGLHTVAGINAAGLAVCSDDLRDGEHQHHGLPTSCVLMGALGANNHQEAKAKLLQGVLLGSRAYHLLDADGCRASLERIGPDSAELPDPSQLAPRVHTNHCLHRPPNDVVCTVLRHSGQRLQQLAHLAARSHPKTSMTEIDIWFATGVDVVSERRQRSGPSERPVPGVVVILDPMNASIHCRGSGPGRQLKDVSL